MCLTPLQFQLSPRRKEAMKYIHGDAMGPSGSVPDQGHCPEHHKFPVVCVWFVEFLPSSSSHAFPERIQYWARSGIVVVWPHHCALSDPLAMVICLIYVYCNVFVSLPCNILREITGNLICGWSCWSLVIALCRGARSCPSMAQHHMNSVLFICLWTVGMILQFLHT